MAEFGSEPLEDLQAKVQEYRSSLATVEAALESDPSEPQLLRLRNDLLEVISLTDDLIKLRVEGDFSFVEAQRSKDSADKPVAAASESHVAASESSGGPAAGGGAGGNLVGRTCLATVNGERRFGEILQVKRQKSSETTKTSSSSSGAPTAVVVVEFFGAAWSSSALPRTEFPPDAVQVLPAARNVAVGTRCQAIATEDGRLHSCVIESQIGKGGYRGYRVKFLGLGSVEELKPDRVYAPQKSASAGDGATAAPNATVAEVAAAAAAAQQGTQRKRKPPKEIITPGGYRIPEYLQAKPTDSQHQLASKKRKINLLKKEQRKEHVEEEAKQRQSSWLSHNKKVASRSFGVSSQQRESIFSTSENPSAKVGVTNSGRGMTSFVKRQRHEYDEAEDDDA